MNKRIHKVLGSALVAGTVFQLPGCAAQNVAEGILSAIKGGVAETTVGITEVVIEAWLDSTFPTED